MRATALSLTICATLILLTNAEQSQNDNTPVIKDQMQKRAIVVYEVEPVGTNRNTDDNLDLPPEDPNAQNSAQSPAAGASNAPPAENGGSSQSGGFGDRKKKDHKEVQKEPVAAEQGKQDAKKEEKPVKDLKDGDKKAKEEKKEEAVTEQPKENKGSEEKENNSEEQQDTKEEETNEEEQDEEEEEEDEEEDEEEEEDNEEEEEEEEEADGQEAQGIKPEEGSPQDVMSADANYSQRGNTWFVEDEEKTAAEKELTFRPASLAPEKTASGDKPQSSTFKSRQGVEKIIDTPDESGAAKRTAVAVTLSAAAIVGSLFFSL